MKSKTFELSRRQMLRGAGACISLPLLEAMIPLQSANAALGSEGQPIRFAGFFMPNGVAHNHWDIKGSSLSKLSRSLQPLAEYRDYVTTISGLNNPSGAHNLGTAALFTGQVPKKTPNPAQVNVGNASFDQIVGNAFKANTTLPTLELGMSSPSKGVGMNGATNVYRSFVSWKNATTPVPHELNPKRAFDRLFKNVSVTSNPNAGPSSGLKPDSSVLDIVLEDAKSLQKRLGKADQQKLDEYLTAVREVEGRLERQASANVNLNITPTTLKAIRATEKNINKALGSGRKGLSAVPQIPYQEYGRLMMDVMALAFWSNSTVASTLMFGDGLHGRNMSFLEGVNGNHHSISHHGNKPKGLSEFGLINQFFVSQYAYFLGRLESMKEGGSNVLENSVVMLGSNISSGQVHNGKNIPVIVAGHAGGKLRGNRNIQAGNKPIAHLHNSLLSKMGIDKRIGGSKEKLRGV
ncbi:MAG: DUF1552 domain-containing protein [Verrucomicrobiales bacterium]